MRGFSKLTWLELKIFMREPLGAIGTILIPVVVFVGLGRLAGGQAPGLYGPNREEAAAMRASAGRSN